MLFRTPRLVVRMAREADAPVHAVYRNDPEIARLQDWPMPYTPEMASNKLAAQAKLDGPTEGQWVTLAIELDGRIIGDLACHIEEGVNDNGGVAEIGYTLAPEHHGKGYAREAAGGLVDHLFATTRVHRIEGSLDQSNVASMRVLEAIGMEFESLTRLSYPIRGGWDDDMRYSMLRADRAAWLARATTPPARIELVDLTPDDAHLWGRLATHHSQRQFVSPMALSFRDALFPDIVDGAPVVPWMRGVLADGERVAFVMMAEVTTQHPEPFLWRLLIDRMHQRRHIGSMVVGQLVAMLGAQGHRSLLVSFHEGKGGPRPFYERLGFVPTGNLVDGEVEARLSW